MILDTVFFFLIAALAVASALMMITRRNPVKGVLFLIVNFFCLAVMYLMLQAQFIAIIQILVYAGAIMVLFLFVMMLLNLGDEKLLAERRSYRKTIAYVLGAVVLSEIVVGLRLPSGNGAISLHPEAAHMGTVEFIGTSLYTEYLLPFEVTSILLLAAMVGVIVLAKKNFR
ncbi:MAG: NADH-quinone oxidoreductase subunit J [Ignavibacteriae bacterium]|nr:NADH-quinone oxidoreductase subunit J [Ignavibacteria bacterium]MBI3365527.1 NADH-quinone oxidoreductase subunit J [Ignavibacteriota bacterium]